MINLDVSKIITFWRGQFVSGSEVSRSWTLALKLVLLPAPLLHGLSPQPEDREDRVSQQWRNNILNGQNYDFQAHLECRSDHLLILSFSSFLRLCNDSQYFKNKNASISMPSASLPSGTLK
jgi:hypothetical protein